MGGTAFGILLSRYMYIYCVCSIGRISNFGAETAFLSGLLEFTPGV
jgi:predicted membrane chloride channel (bestrophin family)